MIDRSRIALVLCIAVLVTAGCASAPEPARDTEAPPAAPPPAEKQAPPAAPEPPEPPVDPREPAAPPPPSAPSPEPPPSTQAPTAEPSVPEPSPPEPPTPDPEPVAEAPAETEGVKEIVDPGGTIEVAATKPGLTRIGAAKCKMCHKVQYASWEESAHAKRTPPLDCESCHGPGSEYKGLSVMKDPAEARAAGLVDPTEEFCRQCHTGDWSDDLFRQAHAHKDDGS